MKKAADNEEANGMHQEEEVYSIRDLLQKPKEYLDKYIFSHQQNPQEVSHDN